MKTLLPQAINSVKEAEAFLTALHGNGESYHPDDDAGDIIWVLPPDQTPTPAECVQLNKLMDDISNLEGFDPCEFLLGINK